MASFFNLAVSIYMYVLIYLTLEATEEGNCVIYCDTPDSHGLHSAY